MNLKYCGGNALVCGLRKDHIVMVSPSSGQNERQEQVCRLRQRCQSWHPITHFFGDTSLFMGLIHPFPPLLECSASFLLLAEGMDSKPVSLSNLPNIFALSGVEMNQAGEGAASGEAVKMCPRTGVERRPLLSGTRCHLDESAKRWHR